MLSSPKKSLLKRNYDVFAKQKKSAQTEYKRFVEDID